MISLKKAGACLTAAFIGAAGAMAYNTYVTPSSEDNQESAENAVHDEDLNYVMMLIQQSYVHQDKVTDSTRMKAKAIEGMLNHLDPHSSYLSPEEMKEMMAPQKEFVGIGVELYKDGDKIGINPVSGSPAERAGIANGDTLTHIDGIAVTGLNLDEVAKKVRGEPNTTIKIKVERKESGESMEFPVIRAKIVQAAISTKTIGSDIGYIRIDDFMEKDMKTKLARGVGEIKTALGSRLKGYIIDLRSNPGGSLTESIDVSDSFLNKGTIVSSVGRTEDNKMIATARRGDIADGKPIIVLVDVMSASASEIVAGALQDNGRAKIMGLQTFGKGSVQTIFNLGPIGGMKFTTALYYTPSGRSIQGKGITPDIAVKSPKIDAMLEELKKAGLKKEANLEDAIANPNPEAPNPVKSQAVCSPEENAASGKDDSMLRRGQRDEMLLCAIEELRGAQQLTKKITVEPKAPGIS